MSSNSISSPHGVEPENQQVPRVLARNAACHQCRRRKLKCDAVRPVCSNCSKPRPRVNPGGAVECTWDDRNTPSDAAPVASSSRAKKKRDDDEVTTKRARLQELEARVAAFEKQLKERQDANPAEPKQHSNVFASDASNEGQSSDPPTSASDPFAAWNALSSAANSAASMAQAGPDLDWMGGFSMPESDQGRNEPVLDQVFDLVWPDWPQDLPSLETVEHIVNVFFDKVPTAPKMLHRPTLLNSLLLPPTHPNFPARALLHGILGLTAFFLPPTAMATRAYFPVGASFQNIVHPEEDFAPSYSTYRHISGAFHSTSASVASPSSPMARFQMWHRRKALQSMAVEFDTGQKLLQAVQAQVMATLIDAYNAWWTDLWMEAGACVRMAVPLQLHEAPSGGATSLPQFRHVLVPPAKDAFEQACRDRTWWMVYSVERSVNMSTSWAESLPDNEITVQLPVTQALFDQGTVDFCDSQSFQSTDLFANHPAQHADGFVIYLKALKLWTDVARFFRQYGRGEHTIAGYVSHPTLRLFFSQINAFRLSFPPHLRRPTQVPHSSGNQRAKHIDVDLITGIMISHAATLAIAEPLITKDLIESDLAKMGLSAIRAMLSLLYDISSTSFDLTLLPYPCSFIWMCCARGLCRFIDASLQNGDLASAAVYRSECEVFRMAIQQQGERHPISIRHLQLLDNLIKALELSTADYAAKVESRCTLDDVFDEKWRPSGNASRNTSQSGSIMTPRSAIEEITINMPTKIGASPAGYVPPQRSASTLATSTTTWDDNAASTTWADKRREPASHLTNSTAASSNLGAKATGRAGLQATLATVDEAAEVPSTGVTTPGGLFGSLGDTSLPFEGMDMDAWFDIANLSFDPDALVDLSGLAQGTGATFDPADFGAVRA